MTRKDVEIIANTMRKGTYTIIYNKHEARVMHDWLCCQLADALWNSNPRFDRTKFLKACGLGQETIETL